MTEPKAESQHSASSDFARQAEQSSPGLIQEFMQFLVENKKWWLIPILVAVGLITALAVFSSSPLAPFIYPFF